MGQAALTREIGLPRFGLFQLAQVVGNSPGCGSILQWNEGGSGRGRKGAIRRKSGLISESLLEICRSLRGIARFCALTVMTVIFRAKPTTAHQGSRTLKASAGLLSTRHTEDKKLNEREKTIINWGILNGIARTTKNMRRVRLLVVPALEPW